MDEIIVIISAIQNRVHKWSALTSCTADMIYITEVLNTGTKQAEDPVLHENCRKVDYASLINNKMFSTCAALDKYGY